MEIKTVQIGFGNVAKIHRETFPEKVKVIAVVDTNQQNCDLARKQGFKIFPDLKSALSNLIREADFWDVCVPTEIHFEVLKELLESGVKKILVEKPFCSLSDISKVENLLNKFSWVKVSIQEQYISSKVVEVIKQRCNEYEVVSPKITMELSKNRMEDIEKGRFIDQELGVFGYEVVHMLAAVTGTGERRMPLKIEKVIIEDMILPSGRHLPKQGKGEILYQTEDKCEVKIFTAMNGEILFPLPEINAPHFISYGDQTRYRIIILEEKNFRIIGQFEPIPGLPRCQGRVIVYRDNKLLKETKMADNPMKQHLTKVIRFFEEKGKNPTSAQYGLLFVKFLGEVMKKIKRNY